MTADMWILSAVIAIALVLFVTEKVGVDVTAILVAFLLVATGLITVEQGLSGFSDQAALTILGLLVLNVGLEKTGVLFLVSQKLVRYTGNKAWSVLLVLLPFIAVLSAFTNNTAVIALFMPMLVLLGNSKGISPSKLLMPMAFICILGGVGTIIGTSTNLLVNSIARQYGIEPFSFFEFTAIGASMALAGYLYLVLIGHHLVPARRTAAEPLERGKGGRFLAQLVVLRDASFIGNVQQARAALKPFGVELLSLFASGKEQKPLEKDAFVEAGDRLILRGSASGLARFVQGNKYAMTTKLSIDRASLHRKEAYVVEALVAPGSSLTGRKLRDLDLLALHEAVPLALRREELDTDSSLADLELRVGDVLLLETNGRMAADPELANDLVLLDTMPMVRSLRKRWSAVLIFIAVIATAALGLVPIVISAIGGILLMVFTKCIDLQDAYKRVEWRVYFLIAGLIPLGIAMHNVGLDAKIAEGFISLVGDLSLMWVIALLFAFTTILTNVMANNATALLMAPIAVNVATKLGIDPKALLLTIMFAASTCFMTPVGYHTLMLIYGPGAYKFRDYFVMGLPLTLIVGTVACWMIWLRYVPG